MKFRRTIIAGVSFAIAVTGVGIAPAGADNPSVCEEGEMCFYRDTSLGGLRHQFAFDDNWHGNNAWWNLNGTNSGINLQDSASSGLNTDNFTQVRLYEHTSGGGFWMYFPPNGQDNYFGDNGMNDANSSHYFVW